MNAEWAKRLAALVVGGLAAIMLGSAIAFMFDSTRPGPSDIGQDATEESRPGTGDV